MTLYGSSSDPDMISIGLDLWLIVIKNFNFNRCKINFKTSEDIHVSGTEGQICFWLCWVQRLFTCIPDAFSQIHIEGTANNVPFYHLWNILFFSVIAPPGGVGGKRQSHQWDCLHKSASNRHQYAKWHTTLHIGETAHKIYSVLNSHKVSLQSIILYKFCATIFLTHTVLLSSRHYGWYWLIFKSNTHKHTRTHTNTHRMSEREILPPPHNPTYICRGIKQKIISCINK